MPRAGFEPAAPGLGILCSILLSYRGISSCCFESTELLLPKKPVNIKCKIEVVYVILSVLFSTIFDYYGAGGFIYILSLYFKFLNANFILDIEWIFLYFFKGGVYEK